MFSTEFLELPYQAEGSSYLAKTFRGGLFDEMGLGKTIQTIMAMDALRIMRAIVICPASARDVWYGEFKKFARINRKIIKGKTIQDLGSFLRGRADVILLSYEMASKWSKLLEGQLYEVIVFDEGHYLKDCGSDRTRRLLGPPCDGLHSGLARWAGRVWFLSGTPSPNSVLDIWTFLRFTGATEHRFTQFKKLYFKPMPGNSLKLVPKRGALAEIKKMIESVSIRRTKVGVGLQIPPIWLTTQMVQGDDKEIIALLRAHPGLDQAVMNAVKKGSLDFIDAPHIATLQRLIGEAKAPAFAQMIIEELKYHNDKIVIFGIHVRALEIIGDALKAHHIPFVKIDGSTSEKNRQTNVARFQADPLIRVFIGNIRASGTAITLTAASDLIMFEADWSPGNNAQAIMRVHRIGQDRRVRGRFITLSNSIDERINAALVRKTAEIAQIGLGSGLTAPPKGA